MQAWFMQMTEKETALELRDTPVPEPGPTQLLVRMRAAALNRGELMPAHGTVGQWKAMGAEGAGEVVAVGARVIGFKPHERVMGRCSGAFSEYALIDEAEAMIAPPALSWEEAASIPLTFLVGYDMLVLQGQLKSGEWLLINGVSSGVGVASLQLGKILGARVIGTSGSASKLEALKALGLDISICTRSADFAPAVMAATGQRGVDLIVNAVGGSVFAENIRALAFEGRLATVGYVDGVLHADLDLAALHAKRLRLFGVSNRLRSKEERAGAVPRFVADVMPRFAAGRLKPQIDRVMDFAQLKEAKARMEAAGHVGKIVLRMPATSLQ